MCEALVPSEEARGLSNPDDGGIGWIAEVASGEVDRVSAICNSALVLESISGSSRSSESSSAP